MSRQINQPINQVRLTNVAVVRMNLKGKRFEIACYRNKVMDYRNGLEKDLSEVLQTERIFINVSKGQFAKHADLKKSFGTKDEEVIAKTILEKGQLQVSDLERSQQQESILAQISTWVASNCVHPTSQRPYTVSQIKHALGKQYQVKPHKNIKKQYLDAVKYLKTQIPIERAMMELAMYYHENDSSTTMNEEGIIETLVKDHPTISIVHNDPQAKKVTFLADPGMYRALDEIAKNLHGRLEIVHQVVTQEGDVDMEFELERKKQLEISTNNTVVKDIEEDSEDDDLAQQLGTVRLQPQNDDSDDEEATNHMIDDYNDLEDDEPVVSQKKNQKKANKKSKKAKRRQKEEAMEREARSQAEKERQKAREDKVCEVVQSNAATAASENGGKSKSCNTCGGSFLNMGEYRAHFRSDWHRFNQKLKLKGLTPVSQQEFELCDAESFFGDTQF